MKALLALALVATPPPSADRWEPFASNPAYEVYGREDAGGVFRYTASRPKAAAPGARPRNYGVNLSPKADVRASAPDVITGTPTGSDAEAVRRIFARPPRGTVHAADCAGDPDCDGGECPRRKPKPKPKPDPPEKDGDWRWLTKLMPEGANPGAVILAVVAGVSLVSLLAFLLLTAVVVVCVRVLRFALQSDQPEPQP